MKTRSLGGYGRSVVWLREHGLNIQQIAKLLKTSEVHVRQLDYRARRIKSSFELVSPLLLVDTGTTTPPGLQLRQFLGIRAEEDSVVLSPRSRRNYDLLRAEIEMQATSFWSMVRYEESIARFNLFLSKVGYPAQAGRIRLRARIQELCGETLLHAGNLVSAFEESLRAFHLYRVAYHESGNKFDLSQVGRLARLLSELFVQRREYGLALKYLDFHHAVQTRLGSRPRPEYHHQLARLAFQQNDRDSDRVIRKQLNLAMNGLSEVVDWGAPKNTTKSRTLGSVLCLFFHL